MFKDSVTNLSKKVNDLWNESVNTWPNMSGFFGQAEPTAALKKDGKIAYADGTNWNPDGKGRGWYFYKLSTAKWEKVNTDFLTYCGDFAGGNYITFESDGTLVMNGNATVWDDVYPSSVSIGVGGTAPAFTAYSGNMKAYEFTGGVTNKEMHIGYQLFHSYKQGSNITPHLHLYVPNNGSGGTVTFDMEYHWDNIGDTGALVTSTLSGTITLAANSTIYHNQIFAYTGTPITGTNKNISSIFMTKITRRQDTDTFAGSVWLLSADIHIEKDTIGSRTATAK